MREKLINCEQMIYKWVQGSEPVRGVHGGLHAAVVRYVRQRVPVQEVLQAFRCRLSQAKLL